MESHIHLTIKKPKKRKPGDHSFVKEFEIAGEKTILLCVADGVSHSSSDHESSKLAVEHLLEHFEASETDLKTTLTEAIKNANTALNLGLENLPKLRSTLTLLAYIPTKQKAFICNIGDSRIYRQLEQKWSFITTDDKDIRPVKKANGDILYENGQAVYQEFITKGLGIRKEVEVNIKEIDILKSTSFVLCSDGFYDHHSFHTNCNKIENSTTLEKVSQEIYNNIHQIITDDASFAYLRITLSEGIEVDTILQNPSNYTKQQLVNAIVKSLDEMIATKDNEGCLLRIKNLEDHLLKIDKAFAIELLNKMTANKLKASSKFGQYIRKL